MPNEDNHNPVFSLPLIESPPFKRNLIKSAVCELKFPILISIRSESIPDEFSRVLRKRYPRYEQGLVLTPGQQAPERSHAFKSRKQDWTVSLRSTAVSLETNAYVSFEDFETRLSHLVEALLPLLDTDFFTRVGLRYINVLPVGAGEIEGWLNPKLHVLMMTPELGVADRAWSELVGRTDQGRYNLRWGFPGESSLGMVLDTDFYCEDIDATALPGLLPNLHTQSFTLFHWCLEKRAIVFMNDE
jgi:uncharacterized protein (TIGR04255 family)